MGADWHIMLGLSSPSHSQPKWLPLLSVRQTSERRTHTRYPLASEVRYALTDGGYLVEKGIGRTVNISSTGILLEALHALPVDSDIELLMAWPALLNNETALTLHATGCTVRVQGQFTAVRVQSYEFRIRGRFARLEATARTQAIKEFS
jgi:hypothetical protein